MVFFFIQHLITAGNKYFMDSRKHVIDFLCSNLHSFLAQKNACSVIEKCVTLCGMERINLIVCLCNNLDYFMDNVVSNLIHRVLSVLSLKEKKTLLPLLSRSVNALSEVNNDAYNRWVIILKQLF